ncbi:MAG: hypothetical protein J4O03_10665 [Chloroflexi bacterium]|nr:hypothetical protein [Chloroflexota bacterium]MCI0798877.1 hypothetical protein [Chloroflexota bacterium]
MTGTEQRPAGETKGIARRNADQNVAKDAQYWEKKVADAMRRVSQRLAAG